jgi:site-specific DNA recombinase
MGRLTLNVLLSFAQFEREVTAERIRDKVAASKRKGLWAGGMVPLGYQLKDGKLSIVEEEADRVRLIFARYLALGSVNRLVLELRERDIRTKIRRLSNGNTRGGVPFTQGPLFYILRNRFRLRAKHNRSSLDELDRLDHLLCIGLVFFNDKFRKS